MKEVGFFSSRIASIFRTKVSLILTSWLLQLELPTELYKEKKPSAVKSIAENKQSFIYF